MAKKKPSPDLEPDEIPTVVEAEEPPPPVVEPEPIEPEPESPVPAEPDPPPAAVTAEPLPGLGPSIYIEQADGSASLVHADPGTVLKDRLIAVSGRVYEHCGDHPDGRWIYRRA